MLNIFENNKNYCLRYIIYNRQINSNESEMLKKYSFLRFEKTLKF